MIEITPSIHFDEQEIEYAFTRSAGPGGQNVNKVSTAVQLRFNVRKSACLPEEVKERLERLAGKRMTSEGALIIEASQYRSQEQNRQEALRRLVGLIRQAAAPPKPRHKTRPTWAAVQRRLELKRKRSEAKRSRSGTGIEW